MPVYRYNMTDAQGVQRQGELVAADERDARQQLLGMGGVSVQELTVIEQASSQAADQPAAKLSRGESEELAAHLSELTSGGIPLEDGLRVLGKEIQQFSLFGKWNSTLQWILPYRLRLFFRYLMRFLGSGVKKQFDQIATRLERGESLDDAVASHGAPADLVAVIRSGLRTGNAGRALMQYVTYVKSLSSLRGRVILSFVYPALLVSLSVALFIGLMVFIVPPFSNIFNGFMIELPSITRALLFISWVMTTFGKGILIAIIAVIGILIVTSLFLSSYTRRAIQLRVPFFGRILQMISMARFTHSLGFLTENEVPMVDSLTLSGESSGDAVIERATALWAKRLETGEALSDAIGDLPGMHADLLQAIQWESDSRFLSRALHALGEMYEGRARIETAKLIAMTEPLVALASGIVFAFTIIALFLPLIQLMNDLA